MRIAISSEMSAYNRKEEIKAYLEEQGYEVADLGPHSAEEQVLYYETGEEMGKYIQEKKADRGIIICGTGAGVSIVVNKFKGVYCVACESVFTAERIPIVNNANVLAMGANVVGRDNAIEMVQKFLDNDFCKDCNEERTLFLQDLFEHVETIENNNFKE